MSSASTGAPALAFEIKSAQLSLVALVLKSAVQEDIARELQHRYGDTPDFFDQEPLLVDLSALPEGAGKIGRAHV